MSIYSKSRTGYDFVTNFERELWVSPLLNRSTPLSYIVELVLIVSDTEIIVKANESITLYQGDVLFFDPITVVITKTATITTENSTLFVLPLLGNILVGTLAATYALLPVYSVNTCAINFSGETATLNNKVHGIWDIKQIINRSAEIVCEGFFIRKDPGANIIAQVARSPRNIYFEVRFRPYVETTVATLKGNATVTSSFNANATEFKGIRFTLQTNGIVQLYSPLKVVLDTFYCPFNFAPYYEINFGGTPQQGVANYCPLDTTGFFDIPE